MTNVVKIRFRTGGFEYVPGQKVDDSIAKLHPEFVKQVNNTVIENKIETQEKPVVVEKKVAVKSARKTKRRK